MARIRLTKIISGGQTGADRAALDAAMEAKIAHGGWLPRGRRTEDGALPLHYQLQELTTSDYSQRTRQNVVDSDGTVIFFHKQLTGGSLLTARLARELEKPCLILDLSQCDQERAVSRLVQWMAVEDVKILNVAGPRASGDPEIYPAVKSILKELLALVKN